MTNFQPWIPPAGAVVDPPVHPETIVDVFYGDGERQDCTYARRHNWSAEGDGPCVVAYAVIEEYKPAPKVAGEWWTVGKHMHDTEADAIAFRQACADDHGDHHLKTRIIHVREVLPGREVVAWAVVRDGQGLLLTGNEITAGQYADDHGGTVVKLTGVMPNE